MSDDQSEKETSRDDESQADSGALLECAPHVSTAEELNEGSARKQARAGRGLALFAILLALVALASSGYQTWTQFNQGHTLAGLESSAGQLQSRAHAMEESFGRDREQLQSRIGSLQGDLAAMHESLQDANTTIDSHSRRLLSLTATTTDDWRLAEVEYLLRLANQRLLTADDVDSAMGLMQASDQILLELNDPRLFLAREALARDLAVLNASGQVDVEGVFLALAALSARVGELPVLVVPEFDGDEKQAPEEATTPEPEQASPAGIAARVQQTMASILSDTLASVRGWIVVQSDGAHVRPLLSPEQQYYLRSNLRLLLNQAQLAALAGREGAYQSSLDSSLAWLQEYFPADADEVVAMRQALSGLLAKKIVADLPDISSSLLEVQSVIEQQHRLASGAPARVGEVKDTETKAEAADEAGTDVAAAESGEEAATL